MPIEIKSLPDNGERWHNMPKRDRKGHFISKRQTENGWTVCGHCLAEDWKNYWVVIK